MSKAKPVSADFQFFQMYDDEQGADSPEEMMGVDDLEWDDEEDDRERPSTPVNKRRRRGELTSEEKKSSGKKEKIFQTAWMSDARFKPWLQPGEDKFHCKCKACNANLKAGLTELERHSGTDKHKKNMMKIKGSQSVANMFQNQSSEHALNKNVKRAEIALAALFAEHNISIQTADHMITVLKKYITDSKIVQNLKMDRTKCTALIKNVLAKTETEETCENLKNTVFSVMVDESTDISKKKNMNVSVKYICPQEMKVRVDLLELIELDPSDCSADKIFASFEKSLDRKGIPITNIIGLGCDNAPVMVGKNNSFASRLKTVSKAYFTSWCYESVSE